MSEMMEGALGVAVIAFIAFMVGLIIGQYKK